MLAGTPKCTPRTLSIFASVFKPASNFARSSFESGFLSQKKTWCTSFGWVDTLDAPEDVTAEVVATAPAAAPRMSVAAAARRDGLGGVVSIQHPTTTGTVSGLRPGQTVLCQVTKNPIGTKGARLTQEVSLAGRFVVLIPNSSTYGISKRLSDEERKRLRRILDEVRPAGQGLIVRTAAEGATPEELRRDVERLLRQWAQIEALASRSTAPTLLYREPPLAVRVIREEFNKDYRGVLIDDAASCNVDNTKTGLGLCQQRLPLSLLRVDRVEPGVRCPGRAKGCIRRGVPRLRGLHHGAHDRWRGRPHGRHRARPPHRQVRPRQPHSGCRLGRRFGAGVMTASLPQLAFVYRDTAEKERQNGVRGRR